MSYWIHLEDRDAAPVCSYGTPPEEFVPDYDSDEPCPKPCYPTVDVGRHAEGGTYVVGGTTDAEISVTYNYCRFFDFGGLDGRTGADTKEDLEKAVSKLGTERSSNYWEAIPGNAGYACLILLSWALQHPSATWRVS